MSAPKRGLGRGLAALLGESASAPARRETLRDVSVDAITPNPFQPRTHFDRTSLDELKLSIAEYGVLVPIIVRERGDRFELVAGERRWRASAELARASIPAIVRSGDDRDTLEVAMIENLQRENLNPLEEAAGFAALIEDHGFSQDEVAQRLGKSRPAVANALRLLALEDGIKAMLVDGRLTAGHARALLAAGPGERLALAQRTVVEGLTVRALERLAGAVTTPQAQKVTVARDVSPEERDFEARLRERYAAHVSLVRGARGGRIEFRFGSEDELVRLGDLLLGDR
jgi:ParB family transcriptional regulator, chromosome partitioning protein